MYIRFKKHIRTHTARWSFEPAPPLVTLAAQVVESKRVGGQPRQRVLKHLATLRMDDEHDPKARRTFWQDATRRLDEMALDDFTRGWLIAEIAARVPPITPDEVAWLAAEEAGRRAREYEYRARLEARRQRPS